MLKRLIEIIKEDAPATPDALMDAMERRRDHTVMKTRELFGNRNRQIVHYVLLTLIVFGVSAFLINKTMHPEDGIAQFVIGGVTFHFDNMLVILISGIVGFLPAMAAFTLTYINMILLATNEAYTVFVYLMAALIAFATVRGRWYKKQTARLALLPVAFAFILGDVQAIIECIATAMSFRSIDTAEIFSYFFGELPECVISVMITYAFFTYTPDWIRSLTFNGLYYMEGNKDRQVRFLRISKLSRRVSRLIIIEGVILAFSAVTFANILLPAVAEDVISSAEGNIWSDIFHMEGAPTSGQYENATDDATGEQSDQAMSAGDGESIADTSEGTEDAAEAERRFVLNRSSIAFDFKLLMMILNTLIPFAVFADYYAQGRIVRPITSMAETIHDFTDADMEEREDELQKIKRLPIKNNDEIGELYDALSEMATEITNFVDETREKERLQADLVIAQKSSENKSNFLSSVSHELRTPINAVLGLDEMILRESDDEQIVTYATDIQSAGKSLLGLVNDILDSSKLEEGKMDIIPTEYELSSTINDLINMIAVKAKDKGLAFDVHVDADTPHLLYGDEIRIKQVILNILTNAVKYTEEGSVTMNIGFERIDDTRINLTAQVKDTGIGIKEEDMAKLFSRFERIEEERNKNIEGTGLGMSIVKNLLKLMGSKLEVESVYGEGSDFHFKVEQKVTKWEPIGNFTEMYQATVAGNVGYRVSYVAPEAKILVVDDTPMNLTVVKGLLKDTLISIDTAESGAETLEKVKKIKYDIIFLDQRMPGMDGVETLHTLEGLEGNLCSGVPTIALTANAVSGSREQFLKEGFTDYLSKPIDSARLEEMIAKYLPDELVIREEDARYAELTEKKETKEDEAQTADASASSEDASPLSSLKGITSIDYDVALANCGSEELLLSVLTDYLEAVPGKAADITRFAGEKDYENYTILVHALKSSSRLIGAMKLSEDAAHLESCGDKAGEGDEACVKEIEERTPALIALYRSYYDKLMPFVLDTHGDDARPEISREELDEALGAIREFVEAFDFDSADDVMSVLKDYRMPEEEQERVSEIKKCLSAVDRDELLRLL